MIPADLLEILCCPETHQPVLLADPSTVAELNRRIGRGELKTRSGQHIKEPVEGALRREDSGVFYLIRNGIPIMLMDESVPNPGI